MKPTLLPATWIKSPPTFHLDEVCLPQLVIYCEGVPQNRFTNPDEWIHIYHQTSGYACNNVEILGKILPLKPIYWEFFKRLTNDYIESCVHPPCSLQDAVEYQHRLNSVGLEASYSYHLLQEGFYPVDIQCLPLLCQDKLPEDLDDYTQKDPSTKFHIPLHWHCAVLGENCD